MVHHSSIRYLCTAFVSILCGAFVSLAQPGANDPTFNPADIGFGNGDGIFPYDVYTIARQADGKLILCGEFTAYNGLEVPHLLRIEPDGSRDMSFDIGTGPNSYVNSVVVQPDGKILVGGTFDTFNGISAPRLVRLNMDGSVDGTFSASMPTPLPYIVALALQPDGKVIAGGGYTDVNEVSMPWIARFGSDGDMDPTFSASSTTPDGGLRALALRADGDVYVGGGFAEFNGTPRNGIVRLNGDGTTDMSFDPGSGANEGVHTILEQPDGQVLIGGTFTTFNGAPHRHLVRLSATGSVDPVFGIGSGFSDPPPGNGYSSVDALTLRANGKILVGGTFTDYNGTERGSLAQLGADGTLDPTFAVGQGFRDCGYVYSMLLLPNEQLMVGGCLTTYNAAGAGNIVRLNTDASLDLSFNPGTGSNAGVNGLAVQPDGKVLVGGDFTRMNGIGRGRIARLNTDGTLDAGFDPGTGFHTAIGGASVHIAVQSDGKVLVAGGFDGYDGTPIDKIVRLNTDGSIDPSFMGAPGGGFDAEEGGPLLIQADGKIIMGRKRLNSDGGLDASFAPPVSGWVIANALQPDGKIILAGGPEGGSAIFTRLLPDGSVDPTFDTGSGFTNNNWVHAIALQPDGRMVLAGDFSSYDGVSRNNIARVNADGSLDTSFQPGDGFDSEVRSLVLQPDGRIIVAGNFNTYNGSNCGKIVRLYPDGSIDPTFDTGTGFEQIVYALALQADGNVVAGGDFISYNGTGRNRIARLLGGGVDCLGVPNGPALPGTACDDGLATTGDDVYGSDCVCSGLLLDCAGVPGGSTGPGAPCDDGDAGTGNDVYDANCLCLGVLIDCEGVIGGPALPGSACDDGDPNTTDDQYDASCVCVGAPPTGDCEGVPGGTALPGTPCNDCDPTTFNDVYDLNCACNGVAIGGIAFQSAELDPSFDPGSGFNERATDMVLQPDGKVIVSGRFTAFDGATRNHIARLNINGTIDAAYATGTGFAGFSTNGLALQSDGKVIVSGDYTMYDGIARARIARLGTNGGLDATFAPGTGFGPGPTGALAVQADGKVLVGGAFDTFNGSTRYDLVRLNSSASLDPSFDIGSGFDFPSDLNGAPTDLVVQPDGRIIVVGGFLWYDGLSPFVGTICRGILRLDQLGGLDNSFEHGGDYNDPIDGFTGTPYAVALQPDGRIVVGGDFTSYEGVARNRIIRLNADGSVDPTFDPGTGFNDPVHALVIQSDGRILVGGDFTSFNGASRERIARLNADGSLDATFQPCGGFNDRVTDLVLQPDGRVLACGWFTAYAGVPRNRIARLFTGDATCIASQLTTTADPVVSCGAVELKFDGSSTIAATEVPGANRYQFRFTNIPGQPAYARHIAFPTRSFILSKWHTLPLKAGRTYNVVVRASFDNGATWCAWGPSCTVKMSWFPFAPIAQDRLMAGGGPVPEELVLYPVPNTGDAFFIHPGDAFDGSSAISIDVHDIGGRLMVSRTLAVSAGSDVRVDLNGALSDGLYIVAITAGDRRSEHRLLIAR